MIGAGKYIAVKRYGPRYGEGLNPARFHDNRVARADPNAKLFGAFSPSEAQTVLIQSINFENKVRLKQSQLFWGMFRVPSCRSGIYRIRVTSDDDSDLFFDGEHVLTNPGIHYPSSKEATVVLKAGTDHQLEVSIYLVRCSLEYRTCMRAGHMWPAPWHCSCTSRLIGVVCTDTLECTYSS